MFILIVTNFLKKMRTLKISFYKSAFNYISFLNNVYHISRSQEMNLSARCGSRSKYDYLKQKISSTHVIKTVGIA